MAELKYLKEKKRNIKFTNFISKLKYFLIYFMGNYILFFSFVSFYNIFKKNKITKTLGIIDKPDKKENYTLKKPQQLRVSF